NHRFYNGEPVTYTTGGTPIGGLATNGTTYYVIVLDSNTIELASSLVNAQNGQAITLSHTLPTRIPTPPPPAPPPHPLPSARSPLRPWPTPRPSTPPCPRTASSTPRPSPTPSPAAAPPSRT